MIQNGKQKIGWGAVLTLALLLVAGCGKKETPAAQNSLQQEGNSSGGGGFGDESSMQLLNWSKELTARAIRQANPQIFANLPSGWTPERLARLIENTKIETKTVASRYDRELMFDYRVPKQGEPYLIATSLFFRAFSSIPVQTVYPQDLEPYLREIRVRLLHEAAHVLGIGQTEKSDYKARIFAGYMNSVFWRNNVICQTQTVPENYPSRVKDEDIAQTLAAVFANSEALRVSDYMKQKEAEIKALPYIWIVNRPYGFGLQMRKFYDGAYRTRDFVRDLLEGKPTLGSSAAYFPQAKAHVERKAELKREFDPAYMDPTPWRLNQQYYKLSNSKDGLMQFRGFFAQKPLSNYSNVQTCDASETIQIPQAANGTYAGTVGYSDTCYSVLFKDENERFMGEMAVQCTESFAAIKNLTELYGEQEIKDPEFLELKPEESVD